MSYAGGFIVLLGLYRLGLMFYGIVKFGKRGDLDRYSLFLLQVSGMQAVGIVFLGLSIWTRDDGAGRSGVFFIVSVLSLGIAALIRIFDWISRMRKPMDPMLIGAALDAEKILEEMKMHEGGSAGDPSPAEDALRRLRSALAPYRGRGSRGR